MTTLREKLLSLCEFGERWLPIEGYPNYLISNYGRVMSNWRSKFGYFKLVKFSPNRQGYMRTILTNPAKAQKNFNIHSLVAHHFIGPQPTKYHIVCHLDDVKTNNVVTNLVWGTSAENSHMAKMNDRYLVGHKHPMAKLSKEDVEYIKKHYYFEHAFKNNTRELAEKFNVSVSTINRTVSGKKRKYKSRQALTAGPLDAILEKEK